MSVSFLSNHALISRMERQASGITKLSGKLHKRVSNYSDFSLKGTDVAKRSIECMYLLKSFNVGYSVSLRSKSITKVKSRDFHVIFKSVLPIMPIKKMLKYT
jgi:hypothetical protein